MLWVYYFCELHYFHEGMQQRQELVVLFVS